MSNDNSVRSDAVRRVSVPGRVWDLLWRDDEFYREVCSNKKVSSSGKFPRCDQWCDESGFHMAFALAGYSPEDIEISVYDNEITIKGVCEKLDAPRGRAPDSSDTEDYPALTPSLAVQKGMILRGIARRNFQTKYYINTSFDPSRASATMKNGLLELVVPTRTPIESVRISVLEE